MSALADDNLALIEETPMHRYGTPDTYAGHDRTTGPDHYVPEGWEELNRGICPRCGVTVSWDETAERWTPDTLTVLVVTPAELRQLRDTCPEELEPAVDLMEALSIPVEEAGFCPRCRYALELHDGPECPTEGEARAAYGDR